MFSGIGGMALGAEWAGIETVAFCESDLFCQKVLTKRWPEVPIFDDIRKLNRQALEEKGVIKPNERVEIVSGGFPCQPFSQIGKREGKEDDRDLWPEMFRIIQELEPTWVVGENVANFANMELERTCVDLENEGYETQAFIIPACGVDAKHQRYRTFILAYTDRFEQRPWNELQQSERDTARECTGDSSIVESFRALARTDSGFRITEEGRSAWPTEPRVDRMAHGISERVDRLRSLGNAVVPQQVYPIFQTIVNITNQQLK